MGQIILVPFGNLRHLQQTLDRALESARRLSADAVVLLRVNPPRCPETQGIDCERLYSELRALQVQVASQSMPIRLDVMPGPVETAIMRYAEQNDVGMVFTGHLRRLFKSSPARPTA